MACHENFGFRLHIELNASQTKKSRVVTLPFRVEIVNIFYYFRFRKTVAILLYVATTASLNGEIKILISDNLT